MLCAFAGAAALLFLRTEEEKGNRDEKTYYGTGR